MAFPEQIISVILTPGTSQLVFLAGGDNWQLRAVHARFSAAGGSNCAIQAQMVPDGVAIGGGTAVNMLSAAIPLTGATNTQTDGTLAASLSSIQIPKKAAVAIVASGTTGSLAGLIVRLKIRRLTGLT